MKNVGPRANILKASEKLRSSLEAAGSRQQFPSAHVLFHEDGNCKGVYLVRRGKVRMSVRNLPKLNRDFGAGSLLGLPSTFTGHPYSLTAVTRAESEIVHVPRAPFLDLMRDRPDLCREATDMLGREVTFIQSALAQRRRQLAAVL
jgi:CRP-like cAMP-binding protein